jgi:NRAMP (natural resistance-associated macrophage protein)-like metal ion transporter
MKSNWRNYIGPGPLIAAAFIGPGTVTVCTLAGVNFGFDLLWALALSMVATIVLQEMAARIGLVTQKGLTEVIGDTLTKGIVRYFSLGLILLAIVLGNAAYEAGTISGGALGIEIFIKSPVLTIGQANLNLTNLAIGLIALVLLMTGNYKLIEKYLIALVIIMSITFLVTAVLVKPSMVAILQGFVPGVDSGNILTIVALIGTTVVPYNLFLHSSLVSKKWKSGEDLKFVRVDTIVAVVLGSLVSMAIVITGASGNADAINNAVDLALGLEPLLGVTAKYFIGFGLFAAGITSAITAPLAGAFVVAGCFGWSTAIKDWTMRVSILAILGLGLVFSSLGIKPVQLITFAQLANGILLPLLSAYILWVINKASVMGKYRNSLGFNVLGLAIWVITLILGIRSIMRVLEGI